jgi:2-methylcitrate dehydratase PrpD
VHACSAAIFYKRVHRQVFKDECGAWKAAAAATAEEEGLLLMLASGQQARGGVAGLKLMEWFGC